MDKLRGYISSIVNEILREFSDVTVKYEYKATADAHLIDVCPKEVYESKTFHDYMTSKVFEFYDLFPSTNLAFVTEDSLVRVTEPEIETSNAVVEVNAELFYWTIEDSESWLRVVENYPLVHTCVTYDFNSEALRTEFTIPDRIVWAPEIQTVEPLSNTVSIWNWLRFFKRRPKDESQTKNPDYALAA